MGKLASLKNAQLDEKEHAEPPLRPSPYGLLGLEMVKRFVPRHVLQRLRVDAPFGLILIVPSSEHVELVAEGLSHVMDDSTVHDCVAAPTPDLADALLHDLKEGRPTVLVCMAGLSMPASFAALAHHRIVLGAHDAAMVKRVIRSATGRASPEILDGDLHPNPALVAKCIVHGLAPSHIVRAIKRIGPSKATDTTLPPLADSPEFGEAQQWGLRVISDIEAWRGGSLPASDMDSACLLVAPPGFGKTHFSKVLANDLRAPLFDMSMGNIFSGDGHLGDVLKRMRKIFRDASAQVPSVLLLDELDAFSRRDARDNNQSFVSSMIDELLVLLDGSSERAPGLVIIGATNHRDHIDPALLRPGRLSRTIEMTLPDAKGIEHILRMHLRNDLVGTSIDAVVRLGNGRTPAELMQAVRRARQRARVEGSPLLLKHLQTEFGAVEVMDADLLLRIAVHEIGHAMVCLLLEDAPKLVRVSLLASAGSRGHVEIEERSGATRRNVESHLKVMLAGRATEELMFGDGPSDGAAADLRTATMLSTRMHVETGLAGSLMSRSAIAPDELLTVDASLAETVENHLQQLYAETLELLKGRQREMTLLAEQLIVAKVLSGREVADLHRAMLCQG